jgi:hypothetical protein
MALRKSLNNFEYPMILMPAVLVWRYALPTLGSTREDSMDQHHSLVRSGILNEQELLEAQGLFDRLCAELGIASVAARDLAAGLMITMVSNGQRDTQHIRDAIARFAGELNGTCPASKAGG